MDLSRADLIAHVLVLLQSIEIVPTNLMVRGLPLFQPDCFFVDVLMQTLRFNLPLGPGIDGALLAHLATLYVGR